LKVYHAVVSDVLNKKSLWGISASSLWFNALSLSFLAEKGYTGEHFPHTDARK